MNNGSVVDNWSTHNNYAVMNGGTLFYPPSFKLVIFTLIVWLSKLAFLHFWTIIVYTALFNGDIIAWYKWNKTNINLICLFLIRGIFISIKVLGLHLHISYDCSLYAILNATISSLYVQDITTCFVNTRVLYACVSGPLNERFLSKSHQRSLRSPNYVSIL